MTALPALDKGARLQQGRHCPCAGRCEKYPALCFDFPSGAVDQGGGKATGHHRQTQRSMQISTQIPANSHAPAASMAAKV